MCLDLFVKETPCGLILVNDHLLSATTSLCILGGRNSFIIRPFPFFKTVYVP